MNIWVQGDGNGECIRLHNEELHILYSSPNIFKMVEIRKIKWTGHVAKMEEGSLSAFKTLTGKPIGKRPRRRWQDNIKTDLKGISFEIDKCASM